MALDEVDSSEEIPIKKPYEYITTPVISKEQLGQEILRTFSRLSGPNMIEYKKVSRNFPKTVTTTVLNEDNEEVEVEKLVGWEKKEFEIPIVVQPEYHEMINDDISRAFLGQEDYDLFLDNINYCQQLRSFSERYDLNLALHYNHFADITNAMVAGSGAIEGQRVTLAKTDIAKTISQPETFQAMQKKTSKKKTGLLQGLTENI